MINSNNYKRKIGFVLLLFEEKYIKSVHVSEVCDVMPYVYITSIIKAQMSLLYEYKLRDIPIQQDVILMN